MIFRYWFLLVIILSVLGLAYRALTLCFPAYRKYLLNRRARFITKESLNTLCIDSTYGDWFLIYKLSQNINEVAFSDLVTDLVESFEGSSLNGNNSKKSRGLSQHTPNAPPETPLLQVELTEASTPFSTP